MKYYRFATLKEMVAFVEYKAKNSETKFFCEAGIYTDDNVWHRPCVNLVDCETGMNLYSLRWNAMSDYEDTQFTGKRAKIEARQSAEWFTNCLQKIVNYLNEDN